MTGGMPDVMILCGGRGSRLQHGANPVPKPLMEIGDRPIVWHVVRIYAARGFQRFLLLTGYRSDAVEAYVDSEGWPAGVSVDCVFTGQDTPTGGRIHAARDRLADGTFCVTYADGVADLDLAAELKHHHSRGAPATMCVVRPELPFGVTELSDDQVTGFREKPRSEHWVNGGFFVFEPEVLDLLQPASVLELEPLEALAATGRLHAWRHEGFWECMDTHKDAANLNDLWARGAPWKVWN